MGLKQVSRRLSSVGVPIGKRLESNGKSPCQWAFFNEFDNCAPLDVILFFDVWLLQRDQETIRLVSLGCSNNSRDVPIPAQGKPKKEY